MIVGLGRMHNAVDAAREAITGRLYGNLSGILSSDDMMRMKITPYPLSREAYASNTQRVEGPGQGIPNGQDASIS